jgi:hypothetical protein
MSIPAGPVGGEENRSGIGNGVSSEFNGRPATNQFMFRAGVIGTGAVSPAWQVYSKSINVSW